MIGWPCGRWIDVVALIVGASFFVQRMLGSSDSLWTAFMKAVAAAFAAMLLLGFAQRFWRGDKLQMANVSPTGGGGSFEEVAEADKATLDAVNALNSRVGEQMETVNRRLYDLETSAFKAP